jgi:CHRD domain
MTALAAMLVALAVGTAQPATAPGAMRARLAPVPIDVAMQEAIAGLGTASATLTGTRLAVDGTYRGLKSAATSVRVFESAKPGLRGPLVGEFASGGGTMGTFTSTLTLTREQAASFAKGLLYVQLHSEKAPDGNLWGWLTPAKGRP